MAAGEEEARAFTETLGFIRRERERRAGGGGREGEKERRRDREGTEGEGEKERWRQGEREEGEGGRIMFFSCFSCFILSSLLPGVKLLLHLSEKQPDKLIQPQPQQQP